MTSSLYAELAGFDDRPAPFSKMTIATLWTDPHIARQMLAFHLDPHHDAASRRPGSIEGFVGWLDERLPLAGKKLMDLGCGPGLYAQRLAQRGAQVTGSTSRPTRLPMRAMRRLPRGWRSSIAWQTISRTSCRPGRTSPS